MSKAIEEWNKYLRTGNIEMEVLIDGLGKSPNRALLRTTHPAVALHAMCYLQEVKPERLVEIFYYLFQRVCADNDTLSQSPLAASIRECLQGFLRDGKMDEKLLFKTKTRCYSCFNGEFGMIGSAGLEILSLGSLIKTPPPLRRYSIAVSILYFYWLRSCGKLPNDPTLADIVRSYV